MPVSCWTSASATGQGVARGPPRWPALLHPPAARLVHLARGALARLRAKPGSTHVSVPLPARFEETARPMGHPDSAGQRRKVLLCLLVLSSVSAFALYHFTGRDYPFYGDELELFDA